jgi:hypothetical protein
MREIRPPGAPPSWAADVLRKRLMRRPIRIEHDDGATVGLLDDVKGMNILIDAEHQVRVIPSSIIVAFEYLEPEADLSDEVSRG